MDRSVGLGRLGQVIQTLAGFFVVLQRGIEEAAIGLARQTRQQRVDGFTDIGGDAQVQRRTAPQGLRIAALLVGVALGAALARALVGARYAADLAAGGIPPIS